jgi:nitrite reductase/ring-hydroxylating ferredoxin subunit
MAEASTEPSGPDLTQGIALAELADGGKLVGHSGGKPILLVRRGNEVFAVGAQCTHYNGPLGDGLVVGDTVRCPWHHACFDLRTGEALRAPALSPVACWRVEQRDGKIFVREKLPQQKPEPRGKPEASAPDRIVIVGGGAAGFAAAEMFRRVHFQGSIVMLSDDDAPPVDRPNLSKDYLAGNAEEDWVPLRPDSFYAENGIDLRLKTKVTAIDVSGRKVQLADGSTVVYDRCCWQLAPSRFVSRSQAPTSRTCIRSARSATARRSSTMPRRRAGRWSWVRALTGLRSRLRSAPAD